MNKLKVFKKEIYAIIEAYINSKGIRVLEIRADMFLEEISRMVHKSVKEMPSSIERTFIIKYNIEANLYLEACSILYYIINDNNEYKSPLIVLGRFLSDFNQSSDVIKITPYIKDKRKFYRFINTEII